MLERRSLWINYEENCTGKLSNNYGLVMNVRKTESLDKLPRNCTGKLSNTYGLVMNARETESLDKLRRNCTGKLSNTYGLVMNARETESLDKLRRKLHQQSVEHIWTGNECSRDGISG